MAALPNNQVNAPLPTISKNNILFQYCSTTQKTINKGTNAIKLLVKCEKFECIVQLNKIPISRFMLNSLGIMPKELYGEIKLKTYPAIISPTTYIRPIIGNELKKDLHFDFIWIFMIFF